MAGCSLSNLTKNGKSISKEITNKGIIKEDLIFNNMNDAKNWAAKQLGPSKQRIYDQKGKWIGWQNKVGDKVYWGHGDWGKGVGKSTFPHLNYKIGNQKGHYFLKDKIINRKQLEDFFNAFKL